MKFQKKTMENKEISEVKGSKRRKRPKEKIKKNCNAILLGKFTIIALHNNVLTNCKKCS